MSIYQISVFVENQKGRLAEVTRVLADAGIDIRALSIADTTDFGILRMIVSHPEQALAALKAADMTVSRTEVVAVCLEDKAGALYQVLATLEQADVGVEYVYAFITRQSGAAYVILRVQDNEKAVAALRAGGIRLLEAEDIYSI